MEAQLARAEQQLQKMEDGIAKREIRLRQLLQQEEDDRAAVRQSIRELNDQNELLDWEQSTKRMSVPSRRSAWIRITSRSWPHSASGNVRWKIC